MIEQPLTSLVNLSGKTAVITGAAMGIGEGVGVRLAEAGANIVIADKNTAAASEFANRLLAQGWKAVFTTVDISDPHDVERMIAFAVEHFGSVDILVNNAGIYPNVPLMELSAEQIDKIIAINLRGSILATKAAAAQMMKQGRGGKIINITSIDALHPSMPGLAVYDASKHGLWGFTKNVALELAPHRIWVNAIAPGGINTPGTNPQEGTHTASMIAEFIKKIPMGRIGEPDDIGRVALFLASDLSSYMTGTQIVVDGGYLLK